MTRGEIAGPRPTPALRARRRIVAVGMAAAAIAVASAIAGTLPLQSGRSETRQVAADNDAQRVVEDLRSTLSDWQIYAEPRFSLLGATTARIDPAELARGAQIATNAQAQEGELARALDGLGLTSEAKAARATGAALTNAIAAIGPLFGGSTPTVIASVVNGERTAFARAWNETTTAAQRLRTMEAADLGQTNEFLDNGVLVLRVVGIAMAVIALVGALLLGQAARRRERTRRDDGQRQTFETVLQQALEMAQSEAEVYGVMQQALTYSVPALQAEMLVADSSRAHFRRVLAAGGGDAARDGCGVVSPKDCAATVRGHSLEFPTSRALNACPYLKNRTTGDCAAACVPVSIGGKTVAVVHATAPDGTPATDEDVRYLEIASRRASERLAMLRAFERSEAQARSDPLTGLLNRRSLENSVHDLRREGTSYVLAFGDLDHFKILNDTHGHEAGDQALRLFSRVMRDSVRPADLVARYGGEEFVIILPDCGIDRAVGVLERIRERLALALTSGRVPSFTVSFGVTSSALHETFDDTVASADRALLQAKSEGRNRVLVAEEAVSVTASPATSANGAGADDAPRDRSPHAASD